MIYSVSLSLVLSYHKDNIIIKLAPLPQSREGKRYFYADYHRVVFNRSPSPPRFGEDLGGAKRKKPHAKNRTGLRALINTEVN